MNILRLSFRNVTSRPLSTVLSLILLILGVGMISLLLQVNRHIQQQMENNVRGIDMVVGAKGSPMQLILSAVYHIDDPTGNIPLHEAKKLQKNRLVEFGIPLSFGDSYEGFKIVGTNHQYPELYKATIKKGHLWKRPLEVTIGATVAKKLSLKIGHIFNGNHGLVKGGESHEDHAYQIVGIFNYTNSVLDQLILTASESVWDVHAHKDIGNNEGKDHVDHHHQDEDHADQHHEEENRTDQHHEDEDHTDQHGEDDDHNDQHNEDEGHADQHHEEEDHEDHLEPPENEHELTAMLIKFRNPIGLLQLPRMVNEKTNLQAAVPAYEISRLFNLMGVGLDTLNTIALAIMLVSGLSVFVSLYNAFKERKYEMALMRSYGATRWQLVWLVIQEGLLLTLIGFILGILFSRLGLWAVSELMEETYHYTFSGWTWLNEEGWLLGASLAIGLLACILPAIHVFRINLSKALANA